MAVCSYIVHPAPGKFDELQQQLSAIPGCEAIPSDNKELMILLTDTVSDADEKKLQETLKNLRDIECLAMTFGQIDQSANKEKSDDS